MTYEATYLPANSLYDPSKGGFKDEDEAWAYVETKMCDECMKELKEDKEEAFLPCLAEWIVYKEVK